jgi:hypothetical protein
MRGQDRRSLIERGARGGVQVHSAAGKLDDGGRILRQREHHLVAGFELHQAISGADAQRIRRQVAVGHVIGEQLLEFGPRGDRR